MIVECIFNKLKSIAKDQQAHLNDSIHDDEVDLKIGQRYDVYGVAFRAGSPWFYVLEDNDLTSLRPHFAGFFKVLDGTLPTGWKYCESGHSERGVAFLPKQWAETSGFYEKLIDEDAGALAILARIQSELRHLRAVSP